MCFCLSGCSFFGNTIEIGQSSEAIIDEEPTTDPDDASSMTYEEAVVHAMEKLENMTLEEKVGQLFVVNLEQIDRKNGTFFGRPRIYCPVDMRKEWYLCVPATIPTPIWMT